MKYLVFILSLTLFACSSEEKEKVKTAIETEEDLVERDGNFFKEYYPGKKQLKMEGQFDENEQRHGFWKYYSEGGITISITEYSHGVRSGVSLVYFANGKLNYEGQYKNDKPVGVWKTYDEKTGKLKSKKNYDIPN